MKLLPPHKEEYYFYDDRVDKILKDLLSNELNLEIQLAQWMYRPFDNYNDWLKYGDTFVRLEMNKEEL